MEAADQPPHPIQEEAPTCPAREGGLAAPLPQGEEIPLQRDGLKPSPAHRPLRAEDDRFLAQEERGPKIDEAQMRDPGLLRQPYGDGARHTPRVQSDR
jgi:hypothetical protein